MLFNYIKFVLCCKVINILKQYYRRARRSPSRRPPNAQQWPQHLTRQLNRETSRHCRPPALRHHFTAATWPSSATTTTTCHECRLHLWRLVSSARRACLPVYRLCRPATDCRRRSCDVTCHAPTVARYNRKCIRSMTSYRSMERSSVALTPRFVFNKLPYRPPVFRN